jgi:hypothetical protein
VAIVLADNLRPHTPRGSRLVRALRAEAQGSLRLVYAPRYAPEAHRIAWLWRIVRQAVTPHHHREEVAVLRDDRWNEFDALMQRPTALLAHIGSPGVLNDEPTQPLAYAACSCWKHLAARLSMAVELWRWGPRLMGIEGIDPRRKHGAASGASCKSARCT